MHCTSLCLLHYSTEGATPYIIPAGGSNEIGVWGYIEAFRELMEQVIGSTTCTKALVQLCNYVYIYNYTSYKPVCCLYTVLLYIQTRPSTSLLAFQIT